MAQESELERSTRRRRRGLFDGAAARYERYRPGYPDEIIEVLATTAGIHAGQPVLEIACGTGQLTESLAALDVDLTAIDIGPAMIAAARRRLANPAISFQVTAFEDFEAADASFDLLVSGTAWHWIDPEVKYRKSARLLRSGGWLAVLDTDERYADPFGTLLRDMWDARATEVRPRPDEPTAAERIAGTTLFRPPIERTHQRQLIRPAEAVVGIENTRATSLSWPEDVRARFTRELRDQLRPDSELRVTQVTTLTMARVLPSGDQFW